MKYAIVYKDEAGLRDEWVGKKDIQDLNNAGGYMYAGASRKNRFFFSHRTVAHAIARAMSEDECVYVVVRVPS